MQLRIIPVRTKVTDLATGLKGTITHVSIDMGFVPRYYFQPEGLDPANGNPLDPIFTGIGRFPDVEQKMVEIPGEVLGTQVTEDTTGITGMCVSLLVHPTECVHYAIQRPGLTKDGKVYDIRDADSRMCSGPAIKQATEEEKKEDIKKKPSPSRLPRNISHLG